MVAAIGDPYCTVVDYKARIGSAAAWATDATRDAVVLSQLKAISRYIDRRVGRFFTKDAAAVARLYFRELYKDATVLVVDDLVSVTTIKVDVNDDGSFAETALATADYELRPLNADKGPEPRPYTQIYATRVGAQRAWPAGIRIQVTGVYGWPAVPEAIQDATVQLAGILRIESPLATMRIPEIGEAIEASAEARQLLAGLVAMYRRSLFV